MASKKEEQEKAEERKVALEDIKSVNESMSKVVAAAASYYEDPIVKDVSGDVVRFASRLAARFPTLQFRIVLEPTGQTDCYRPTVYADPFFKPIILAENEFYAEKKAKDALAIRGKADTYFPQFNIVQVYAQGLELAQKSDAELASLKKKYEDLKNDDSGPGHGYGYGYGPPCMMMMRRRGGF